MRAPHNNLVLYVLIPYHVGLHCKEIKNNIFERKEIKNQTKNDE